MKQVFPGPPEVPISRAVRAGDFVFTSAFGAWTFDPARVTFDEEGNVVDDGTGHRSMPFAEQTHRTFDAIAAALSAAGCGLADVVSCECWLADPRDFVAFNAIYATYFSGDPPVRAVFPMRFLFSCRIEMKVLAYKPAGL